MAMEEVLIKIKSMLDGGGFEKAKSGLKTLEGGNKSIKIDDSSMDDLSAKTREAAKRVQELDGLAPKVKPSVDDAAIGDLDNIQKRTEDLDGLAPKIKPTVDSSEAQGEIKAIENGLSGLEGMAIGVGSAVGAGVLIGGGYETALNMDKAWRSWVGSIQHSGASLEDAKTRADELYGTVNRLSSEGQSSDSFFKNIANIMISQNNQISDSTLQMTEEVIAGYEMMRGKSGDTLFEMEREIQAYLSTGETGRLTELESIGGGKWMPLLEAADTAEERIKVLHDLLEEEGIMSAINIEGPSKSIDQLKAMFDASMTEIGTTIIDIVKPIADFIMDLDEQTGGLSTKVLSLSAVAVLVIGALSGLKQIFDPALKGASAFLEKLGVINRTKCAPKQCCTGTGSGTGTGIGGGGIVGAAAGIAIVAFLGITSAAALFEYMQSKINPSSIQKAEKQWGPDTAGYLNYFDNINFGQWMGGQLTGTFLAKGTLFDHVKNAAQEQWERLLPNSKENLGPLKGLTEFKGLLGTGKGGGRGTNLLTMLGLSGDNPISQILTGNVGGIGSGSGGGGVKSWFDDIFRGSKNDPFVSAAGPGYEKPSLQEDLTNLFDFSRFGIKWPEITPDSILGVISPKIPFLSWKIPSIGDVKAKIGEFIPKLQWLIPNAPMLVDEAGKYIEDLGWDVPSALSVLGKIFERIPVLNWQIPSANDILNMIMGRVNGSVNLSTFSVNSGGLVSGVSNLASNLLNSPRNPNAGAAGDEISMRENASLLSASFKPASTTTTSKTTKNEVKIYIDKVDSEERVDSLAMRIANVLSDENDITGN